MRFMPSVKQAVSVLSGLVAGTVDTVLPPLCLSCRRPVATDGGLCAPCWREAQQIERPYCEVLGTPFAYDLGPGAVSADAIAHPPAFDRARAAFVYKGVARSLVHRLKYQDRQDLGRWMAGFMVRAGSDLLADADIIVPVPLHFRRLWGRRFNQAAHLARWIGRDCTVPVDTRSLVRARPTRRQVGLGAKAREDNVRGAFRLADGRVGTVKDRRVLMVDDVLTTGATVDACARALRRGGARSVDVLVFARVVPGQDDTI